jgi:hypothetical protein
MDHQTKAVVTFCEDTDDPKAALAALRQVLAEVEVEAAVGVAAGLACLDPQAALATLEAKFQQAVCLGRGLAALVERVMEAFDEDTWRDFLADEQAERLGYDPRVECVCGDTLDHGYPTPQHETAGDPDDYVPEPPYPCDHGDPCECADSGDYDPADYDPEYYEWLAAERWQDMAEEAAAARAADPRLRAGVADVDDEGHEVPFTIIVL